VAASNRAIALHDAAEWYGRGEEAMRGGRLDPAIADFRRAAVRNRTERRYVLALGRALAVQEKYDEARQVLTTLREAAPEDAEVNLELARLAARRQDVTEAVRFYHNALYAPWPPELSAKRRDVRFEFVSFLLKQGQAARATSELLALTTDLPDDAPSHLKVGRLFEQAGDHTHALQQFQGALKFNPTDDAALAGAARSAFQLGRYSLARSYLRRARPVNGDVAQLRELLDLVLSNDPLAPRIGSAERRRRLIADLDYATRRLQTCSTTSPASDAQNAAQALQDEADAFESQLAAAKVLDQDTVEVGVDLVDRVAEQLLKVCTPATSHDRAVALIGRQHSGEPR
jgi:tetratricopeptide (TPR) repeat protein